MPGWIGWALVAWNLGWLIVVLVFSPGDLYYPLLHFVPLLVIGISLLVGVSRLRADASANACQRAVVAWM